MAEQTVVSFPIKRKRRDRAQTTDEMLVADIRKAWRRLGRTIEAARRAGLTVETEFHPFQEPVITRQL